MFKTSFLALAATLVVSAAHAQTTIDVSDIATRAGGARFEREIRRASSRLCQPYRGLARTSCRNEVREEALSLLPEHQRLAYLRGQQDNVRYASRSVQAN